MDDNMRMEKDSVKVFVGLAEEFYRNDAYEQAINYCRMALHQVPDMEEAKELLIKCYEKTGEKDKIAELRRVSEGNEEDSAPEKTEEEQRPDEQIEEAVEEEEEEEQEEQEEPEHQGIEEEEEEEHEVLSADQTEDRLESALADINSIKGVLGSIIIEESGIIIKEKTVEELDAEIASALFSTIFSVCEDSVEKLELGEVNRVFIEIGKVRIYLFKGNGYIIGIFTEEIVKIGLIHVRAKQLLKNIKEVLGV
ncbi:MAG: roadblock/LC7 domain-containing protein [bacterium]